jgi:hypothetical protein
VVVAVVLRVVEPVVLVDLALVEPVVLAPQAVTQPLTQAQAVAVAVAALPTAATALVELLLFDTQERRWTNVALG